MTSVLKAFMFDEPPPEKFYILVYIDKIHPKMLFKQWLLLRCAKELQSRTGCRVIVYTDEKWNECPTTWFNVYDLISEDVNYKCLCDIERKVPVGNIYGILSIHKIGDIAGIHRLFLVASLSYPGYFTEFDTKDLSCLMITTSSRDRYLQVARHINPNVIGCVEMFEDPVYDVLDLINISLKPRDILKVFNKYGKSGGRDTKEEQEQLGANLEADSAYRIISTLCDNGDIISNVKYRYGPGVLKPGEKRLLTGEVKAIAAGIINELLVNR